VALAQAEQKRSESRHWRPRASPPLYLFKIFIRYLAIYFKSIFFQFFGRSGPVRELVPSYHCDAVCRYMKGRITRKQVNTAVDELNKAIDAKYVMLKTSKSHMTAAVQRAIRQYKDQERKETQGVYPYFYCCVFRR